MALTARLSSIAAAQVTRPTCAHSTCVTEAGQLAGLQAGGCWCQGLASRAALHKRRSVFGHCVGSDVGIPIVDLQVKSLVMTTLHHWDRKLQSRAEQSRVELSRAEQSRAEQSRAGHGRAGQGRAEQSRAEQSRAEQSRVEQSRAEQSRAEQSRAEHSRAQQSKALIIATIWRCTNTIIYHGMSLSRHCCLLEVAA
jgi:flagellar biosynthesis GTPase FlhF